jgi:hypothetical protein
MPREVALPKSAAEESKAAESRDVRRVAVAPEVSGSLSDAPAPAASPPASVREVAGAEKKQSTDALARDERVAVGGAAKEKLETDPVEEPARTTFESLTTRSRQELAAADPAAPSPRSMHKDLSARSNAVMSAPAESDAAGSKATESGARPDAASPAAPLPELDALRALADEWERYLRESATAEERGPALDDLVRIRARLVSLDANECAPARATVETWRREGTRGDEAIAAAESIERSCPH